MTCLQRVYMHSVSMYPTPEFFVSDISSDLYNNQMLASQLLFRGLYLLGLCETNPLILCHSYQSAALSAEVTSPCIIIYFDEPTSPRPAVLTRWVQLQIS